MGVCENEGLHVLCLVAELCLTQTYLSLKKSVLMYFRAYFLIVTCKILVLLSILVCKMSFVPWRASYLPWFLCLVNGEFQVS